MKYLRLILPALLLIFAMNFSINAGSEAMSNVNFYGHNISLTYDYHFQSLRLKKFDQLEFNTFSKYHRNKNLAQTAERIENLAELYQLDDIGKVILIDKFIEQTLPTQTSNDKTFVKYLILKELQYDVLLTRTGNRINCLGNLSFTPGRYLFITYNNKVYKDLNFKNRISGGKHFIFQDTKKTYKTISRDVLNIPKVNADKAYKQLSFNYGGDDFELEVVSNKSVLSFLQDLPMYNIGSEYTKLRFTSELNRTLMPFLRAKIQGMSKEEAASFLLAFVQQTTPYGSDYDKYGEERFYYPEETVMAQTADCEDKTFLLAYLSKNLLGVNPVALYFENDQHLAIGLAIPDYQSSYSFTYKGKKYVACEPTAKTPRLGFSNFNLKRVTKVIEL